MKTKNTLIELLRHQLKLAEAGESFEDKFEFFSGYSGEWIKASASCIDFMDGDDWRIVDQDQPLSSRGWIRHTGDTCPVHPLDMVIILVNNNELSAVRRVASHIVWENKTLTHYRVTKKYVKEEHTARGLAKESERQATNYDEMLKTLKLIASRDWHYTSDVVDIARKTVEKITGAKS